MLSLRFREGFIYAANVIVSNLALASNEIKGLKMLLTLFLSELELRGSSMANIREDTIMQTSTTFPNKLWLQMKWHMIRNLENNGKTAEVET